MSRLDRLIAEFEAVASRPWSPTLAGPQRVWMIVYDEADERRLRARLDDFAHAARSTGHPLTWCDLTGAFAKWMAGQAYRDAYFESPDLLTDKGPLEEFRAYLAGRLRKALATSSEEGLVGLVGVGTLFGVAHVSALIKAVEAEIPGRLVVLFPGTRSGSTYRLLDARDGWDYLALPIPA